MSVVELKVPTIGESISEVTLSDWLVADGDYVEMDQVICEFESDKATLEFPSEAAGVISLVAAEGDDLEIGAVVAKLDTSASKGASSDKSEKPEEEKEEETEKSVSTESDTEQTDDASDDKGDISSPAAAKMMREHSIDSSDVKGTGKDGRITKADVQGAIDNEKKAEKIAPKKEEAKAPAPSSTSTSPLKRETHRKKMTRMRRTISKRLVSAKNETAMLTTFNEVDLTEVMALRKKYQEKFVEKNNIKLGFMSLFAKACAKALMEMPDVNAFLDGNELVYHDYVDISIAISTDNGLVVPPVKNVESKSFAEVEHAIKELAEKARNNKLTLDELSGGTFTITNGGIFGSMMSTPILNPPQSAILGMHNIIQRPVAIDGEVVIRPMMYLALSYDHRVVDGSTSVTFLVKVKKYLEDPITLLMEDL